MSSKSCSLLVRYCLQNVHTACYITTSIIAALIVGIVLVGKGGGGRERMPSTNESAFSSSATFFYSTSQTIWTVWKVNNDPVLCFSLGQRPKFPTSRCARRLCRLKRLIDRWSLRVGQWRKKAHLLMTRSSFLTTQRPPWCSPWRWHLCRHVL